MIDFFVGKIRMNNGASHGTIRLVVEWGCWTEVMILTHSLMKRYVLCIDLYGVRLPGEFG